MIMSHRRKQWGREEGEKKWKMDRGSEAEREDEEKKQEEENGR